MAKIAMTTISPVISITFRLFGGFWPGERQKPLTTSNHYFFGEPQSTPTTDAASPGASQPSLLRCDPLPRRRKRRPGRCRPRPAARRVRPADCGLRSLALVEDQRADIYRLSGHGLDAGERARIQALAWNFTGRIPRTGKAAAHFVPFAVKIAMPRTGAAVIT
jgi:hypothetical protein